MPLLARSTRSTSDAARAANTAIPATPRFSMKGHACHRKVGWDSHKNIASISSIAARTANAAAAAPTAGTTISAGSPVTRSAALTWAISTVAARASVLADPIRSTPTSGTAGTTGAASRAEHEDVVGAFRYAEMNHPTVFSPAADPGNTRVVRRCVSGKTIKATDPVYGDFVTTSSIKSIVGSGRRT